MVLFETEPLRLPPACRRPERPSRTTCMSVLLETSVGDLVIDLEVDACPKTCENFLKLCKVYYYNLHAFFNGTYISCSDANPDALLPLSLQGLFWHKLAIPQQLVPEESQYGLSLRHNPLPTRLHLGISPQSYFPRLKHTYKGNRIYGSCSWSPRGANKGAVAASSSSRSPTTSTTWTANTLFSGTL